MIANGEMIGGVRWIDVVDCRRSNRPAAPLDPLRGCRGHPGHGSGGQRVSHGVVPKRSATKLA